MFIIARKHITPRRMLYRARILLESCSYRNCNRPITRLFCAHFLAEIISATLTFIEQRHLNEEIADIRLRTPPVLPLDKLLRVYYIDALLASSLTDYQQSWGHPQNRKHTTYRNAVVQRRTSPRLQATCVENLAKFGCVRYTNGQTDRQTDTHALRGTPLLSH